MKSALIKTIHEQLGPGGPELTSIYFRYGGNIYIFSYQMDGVRKHTLIDTGDKRHSDSIMSLLKEANVDPKAIERIIITHSHPDHYGLAHFLAKQSGATITVHHNFEDAIEANRNIFERNLLGLRNPKELKECKIEYLSPQKGGRSVKISGLDFPRVSEPISFGGKAKLDILAIPESEATHTRDQLVLIYSIRDHSRPEAESPQGYRPSADILFSGDLWLMRGPMFDRKMKGFSFYIRRGLFRVKSLFAGRGFRSVTVIEQDMAVKEALKGNFSIIRVKPGHGEEFLGSRILPFGLPADSDLLKSLGYGSDLESARLKDNQLDKKIADLLEQAYNGFIREVQLWQKQGYSYPEITEFLVRIYKEQYGGSKAVAYDRKQRKEHMQVTLSRLQKDTAVPQAYRQLAAATLEKLSAIKD
jgi:hypothetical protein